MSNWELFRLLCLIVARRQRPESWAGLNSNEQSALLQLAGQRDLLPALAMGLQHELAAGASPPLVRELNAELLRNTRQKMQITAQALKLCRQLNRAGITPVFLKGTALLLTGERREPGFRRQVDIDVLVPEAQLVTTCNSLLLLGYHFYLPAGTPGQPPQELRDTSTALHLSRAHHHVLPMAKPGYGAMVEVHRHHLPRRFQGRNPVQQVFDSAQHLQDNGASYLVPAPEQMIIQQILGSFLHDGYYPRFDFPVRTGHDYLSLTACPESLDKNPLNRALIQQRCGKLLPLFDALVCHLMNPGSEPSGGQADGMRWRLQMMRKRMNSPGLGHWLDRQARARHLGHSLLHNSAKLPNYLKRVAAPASSNERQFTHPG